MATAEAAEDGAVQSGIGCPSRPCHDREASSEENVRQEGTESSIASSAAKSDSVALNRFSHSTLLSAVLSSSSKRSPLSTARGESESTELRANLNTGATLFKIAAHFVQHP